MQQLITTFGINWQLLLIQAVNFGVLLTALTYFLYRPLMRVIDDRRAKIAEGVQAAEAAEQKLTDAKSQAGEIVGAGARESEALIATARARADQKSEEMLKVAQIKAENTVREGEARALEEQRRIMRESEGGIARAATLAAEKILRQKSA